jgi:hypothetical protein
LGPRIFPFRDAIERYTKELAGRWTGETVASDVDLEAVRESPGVYLRLRLENALHSEKMEAAASRSLHDGFTSCFFVRAGAPDPRKGPKCESLSECAPGLLCNEWDVCAPPPRPYNMRLAYRALRILSPRWTDSLHEATSDLQVRVQERDLDAVTKNDVPVAIEVLSRARFLTVVLDEDPEGGLPEPMKDAGWETGEERLQRVGHKARVGVWNLRRRQQLIRLRREASGQFVPVGERVVRRAETVAAQSRQANSCALAVSARRAVEAVLAARRGGGEGAARSNASLESPHEVQSERGEQSDGKKDNH